MRTVLAYRLPLSELLSWLVLSCLLWCLTFLVLHSIDPRTLQIPLPVLIVFLVLQRSLSSSFFTADMMHVVIVDHDM